MALLMHLTQVLIVAGLCVCCHGAATCVKKGACKNIVEGSANQSRPVLSGIQNHANADGTCKYGHGGIGGKCEAGLDCGYTRYECACLDEDTAAEGQGDNTSLMLFFGFICAIVPVIAMGVVLALEKVRAANEAKRSVAPSDIETNRPKSSAAKPQSPRFSDVRKAPPAEVDQKANRPTLVIESGESKCDGLGCMCFALMGALSVFGIILIVLAFTDNSDQYYNECESA